MSPRGPPHVSDRPSLPSLHSLYPPHSLAHKRVATATQALRKMLPTSLSLSLSLSSSLSLIPERSVVANLTFLSQLLPLTCLEILRPRCHFLSVNCFPQRRLPCFYAAGAASNLCHPLFSLSLSSLFPIRFDFTAKCSRLLIDFPASDDCCCC